VIEDPAALPAAAAGARLVCADAFDGDAVVAALRANPGARGVLWTAEPLKRALRYMAECPQVDARPRAARTSRARPGRGS
jgi:hypothetical protein